jgi:hypothetical protein
VGLAREHFPKLKPDIIVDAAFQRAEVPFYPCDIRDSGIGKPDEMHIALGMPIVGESENGCAGLLVLFFLRLLFVCLFVCLFVFFF